MQPTDALYEEHRILIERQAASVLSRCFGSPDGYEGMGISKDDLVQVGAEKWTRYVTDWEGEDGEDLRKLVATVCWRAMFDYVLHQHRRAKRQVAEEAALTVVDEDACPSEGRIDMANVHALPADARDAVLRSLGLEEDGKGNFVGSDAAPTTRTRLSDLSPSERAGVRESIRTTITGEED